MVFYNYFFLAAHNYVKTSVSRPLSKPRVRNPLNSMKPPSNQSTAHRDSPTQLEKEFLSSGNGGSETGSMPTGWADTSWEEEYFTTIPEDITILNSSLSSSLSSLCAGRGDLEGAREASSEVTLIPAAFFCVCINFCENSESRFGDVCILFSKLLTFFHTL